jgi:hypothetical protein
MSDLSLPLLQISIVIAMIFGASAGRSPIAVILQRGVDHGNPRTGLVFDRRLLENSAV